MPVAEPLKIDSVVVSVLVKTENEGLHEAYPSGDERLVDKAKQTVSTQSGKLNLMRVVQCRQGCQNRAVGIRMPSREGQSDQRPFNAE